MSRARPSLTFVVTCKGRLQHLRQSLPHMLDQPGTKTIVVDANCPDGTGVWVRQNHAEAEVVDFDTGPNFNLSAARNAGLAKVKTPWVCFVDADVVLSAAFIEILQKKLEPQHYFTFANTKEKFGIAGTVIAETATVMRCGGYDEVIQGYGSEDYELYANLDRHGCSGVRLPDDLVSGVLAHATADRSRFYEVKDIRYSVVVNGLYRVLKNHVRTTNTAIDSDLEGRKRIYAEAVRAVALAEKAPDGNTTFEVVLPNDPIIYAGFADLRQVIKLELSLRDVLLKKPQTGQVRPQ